VAEEAVVGAEVAAAVVAVDFCKACPALAHNHR